MTDLVEFLRARLDEDEQAALDAPGLGRWEVQGYHVYDPSTPKSLGPVASNAIGYVDHIARHDPARVLCEVEAKRRLLDGFIEIMEGDYAPWNEEYIRLLALPYAAHEDYNEAWRP